MYERDGGEGNRRGGGRRGGPREGRGQVELPPWARRLGADDQEFADFQRRGGGGMRAIVADDSRMFPGMPGGPVGEGGKRKRGGGLPDDGGMRSYPMPGGGGIPPMGDGGEMDMSPELRDQLQRARRAMEGGPGPIGAPGWGPPQGGPVPPRGIPLPGPGMGGGWGGGDNFPMPMPPGGGMTTFPMPPRGEGGYGGGFIPPGGGWGGGRLPAPPPPMPPGMAPPAMGGGRMPAPGGGRMGMAQPNDDAARTNFLQFMSRQPQMR